MANENTEISDIVKKCKILLLDIEGTTTSISFVKDKLFPYAEENVKEFLETKWEEDDVKEAVTALRKLALEDKEKSVEGAVEIPAEDATKEEQIEGLVKNVKWQMSSDRKAGPLKQLQGLIWKQGYDKGDIKGHVYDDVLPALEQWRSVEGRKIYIYSSGSVQAQKLLFGQSSAGDLLPHIDGHFDTAVGAKQEEASYKAIAEKIDCKADEILFLTDILKEAEAALAAGLQAALVSRPGNAPLPPAAPAPVLHSLDQLHRAGKRKPPVQDEQPAKVPKTEIEGDVKTVTEETVDTVVEASEKNTETEPEKMEVEEKPTEENESKPEGKGDFSVETSAKVETVVEEVVDKKETNNIPEVEMNPVVEEVAEKPAENEVEKMETESTEKEAEKITEDKPNEVKIGDKNDEETAPIPEETPPTVVTEIEEITDDKTTLSEVADIIDDIVPVVEEPTEAEDIENLKNVGEVLEKECDEILSKVQDVTNLDSIPLKPLLNPIAEETMETENIDSNDIVDRILDTEIELGMKPSDDIPVSIKSVENTPVDTAITEVADEKCKKAEPDAEVKDDKAAENITEENKEDVKEMETISLTDKAETQINEKEEAKTEPEVESQEGKEEKKPEEDSSKIVPEEITMETDAKVEESKETNTEESKTVEKIETEETKTADGEIPEIVNKELPTESSTDKDVPEAKETSTEEVKTDSEVTDAQINGNKANGDSATANLNGDASKDEELSSRLSVENGKEAVNGSNGDSIEEQGQGDNKVETGVSDIKVKTVATDETRSDPIEQPTEA